ncbi:chromatin remodeling protein EBS isoform X1 [Populus alba]
MAKTKPGKKDLDSYTIKGTNKVVKPGDCVLMRPSDTDKLPYVALVEKIEADHRNNVKVRVRWYYRPEESIGGRRQFHGAKELFLSDHYDVQSAHTIEGKCTVHSFKNYSKLENVGAEDYFCRFEYKASTGGFTPDRVAVYCKCEMPYNPDDLMVQCEGCKDWFHPSCTGMTIEEAKKLDRFLCSDCSSDDDAKRSMNVFPVSPSLEAKVSGKILAKGSKVGFLFFLHFPIPLVIFMACTIVNHKSEIWHKCLSFSQLLVLKNILI